MEHRSATPVVRDASSPALRLSDLRPRILRVSVPAAGIAFGLALALGLGKGDGMRAFQFAWLQNFTFVLSISLGALFFVILQHLTRAGWSVVIRRVAEIMAATTIPLVVLFLPVLVPLLFGSYGLYSWNNPELIAHDALVQGKTPYLNVGFFFVRCVFYFGLWGIAARYFLTRSAQQDESRQAEPTEQMQAASAPWMLVFALTVTFASIDWLMSLDPHWFSTIYGLYFFAGCVVGFLAAMIVVLAALQRAGRLTEEVTTEHYHDLAKLLFGFIFFWGYIAFSQYLLIWYANIPEETTWYLVRQEKGWQWISLLLLFGHFIVPFVGLLSRSVRRNKRLMVGWSLFLLAMHWIDLYWLVMPQLDPQHPVFGLLDLCLLAGMVSAWVGLATWVAGDRLLLPLGDPRLRESLAFRNA